MTKTAHGDTAALITVYYDGLCGLCRKEIRYYQRIAPAGVFDWQDIARDASVLAIHNIDQQDALRRLHLRDADGSWHIGVTAFAAIWDHLDYWRFLAPIIRLPLVRQMAQFLYNRFADYRFARLPHCQIFTQ